MADKTDTETTVTVETAPVEAAAQVAASAAQAATLAANTVQQQANEAVANAKIEAAETLAQKEGELSWLREHATRTDQSLQNLGTELAATRTENQEMKTGIASILEMFSSLTRPQRETESLPKTETVPPKEAKQNQGEEENPDKRIAPVRKRRLI